MSQPGYLKLMGLFNLHKPLHSTDSCANEFLNVCEALGYQNDEFHRKADEDINISVFVAGLGQWAVNKVVSCILKNEEKTKYEASAHSGSTTRVQAALL